MVGVFVLPFVDHLEIDLFSVKFTVKSKIFMNDQSIYLRKVALLKTKACLRLIHCDNTNLIKSNSLYPRSRYLSSRHIYYGTYQITLTQPWERNLNLYVIRLYTLHPSRYTRYLNILQMFHLQIALWVQLIICQQPFPLL